jgi:hypothetical protein
MNGETNNLTSIIEKEEIQGLLEGLIGEYGWLLLIAITTILAKDMIMNLVQGLLVFMGNGFNNDDIIYISGRQARIVRVGIRNTVFYMTDRGTKMLVPNEQLKHLTIEKALPKNGGAPYLPKGNDPNFIAIEEIPIDPAPVQVEVVTKPTSRRRVKK